MNWLPDWIPQAIAVGLTSALGVCILVWMVIHSLLFKVKQHETLKRCLSLAMGAGMTVYAHGIDLIHFGHGPMGYHKALFFGLLGGGLAPLFHDQLWKRMFPGKGAK